MIAAVVSYDNNYGIGYNGELLFYCKEDMKRFKDITLYGTVVMGSKTYLSIPDAPLKNRYNIVISNKVNTIKTFDDIVATISDKVSFHTIDEVEWILERVRERDFEKDNYYVIGGAKTFDTLIDYCDYIYATEIDTEYDNVDSYFPRFKETGEWILEECGEWKEHNTIKYRFCKYSRIHNDKN